MFTRLVERSRHLVRVSMQKRGTKKTLQIPKGMQHTVGCHGTTIDHEIQCDKYMIKLKTKRFSHKG